MAIVLGNKLTMPKVFGNSRSVAYTVPSGKYRVLIFKIYTGGPQKTVIAASYNGVSIVADRLWTVHNFGGNECRVQCFYMIDPPKGSHTLAYGLTGNCSHAAVVETWLGVDPDNPFGAPVTNTGNTALMTVTVASEAGEVVTDGVCFNSDVTRSITIGADQTNIYNQTSAGLTIGHGASWEDGKASNVMTWTLGAAEPWAAGAVALKPVIAFAIRPIEYTLDAWDPEQRIFDADGHEVPRYKIKPNKWCRIVGLESTTAIVYESNYEDPTLVYFESVSYDGETDEVSIITNRGDLPEVIMARLASGSTG